MADLLQRRRYPRAPAPKGLVVAWQIERQRCVSYLESVALGGLFIRTAQPPPVQSTLSVLMDVPSGEVRARAVVRRVAPALGMGIEFIAMSPEDRARLGKLLRPLLAER
jgi:hypothetical protein